MPVIQSVVSCCNVVTLVAGTWTETSHFRPTKFDWVGKGVREGQNMAQATLVCAKLLASEPTRGPEMAQGPWKWTQINWGEHFASCCNVILSCFYLHLVSATQESKRSAWKTRSCMNIACSSFVRYLRRYKKCMEHKKLLEHHLLVLCQVFKDLSRAREVKVDLKL